MLLGSVRISTDNTSSPEILILTIMSLLKQGSSRQHGFSRRLYSLNREFNFCLDP